MFIQDSDYSDIINNEELAVITANNPNNRKSAETKAISKISHVLSRQYDTNAIFSAQGADRDATIIEYVIYYTLYILFGRIAKDKVPADRYEQYAEAREFFRMCAEDDINTNLPRKQTILGQEESPAIRFGSEERLSEV